MENEKEIMAFVSQKQAIETRLDSLIYGSAEIREKDGKRYIYVHYRDDGVGKTKYAGEYSDELYNLILNNNLLARELKKKLKETNKRLNELGYKNTEINENVKLNIDFARKNLVSTIYKQALLEGVSTTYADTENIIEGGKVNNMTSEDIQKVINLKRAWEFILNENVIVSKTSYSLLCQINKNILDGFFYNAGIIRSTPVSIGGTTWKPEYPIEDVVKNEIDEIMKKQDCVEKGIELVLYVMKKQVFIDGNKRTAIIFANHYYISHAMGLIAVPEDLTEEFKKLLIDYYEGKDTNSIVKFLKDKCFMSLK